MRQQIPLLLNSKNGDNLSPDGSSFLVKLEVPIRVPRRAKSCWIEVISAEVPNTVPNVYTGSNDTMVLTLTIDATTYVEPIVFPQGTYDLDTINDEINRQLRQIQQRIDPGAKYENMIQITANEATQYAILEFDTTTTPGVTLTFDVPNSIGSLLGLSGTYSVPAQTKVEYSATEYARINSTEFFLVHCDLVQRGIRFNNDFSQIVAQVLIDVSPGSMIMHRPYNIPKIPANKLIGANESVIRVWLTNQDNVLVNTSGEFYTVALNINYIL